MITPMIAGALLLQAKGTAVWNPLGISPEAHARALDSRIAKLRAATLRFQVQSKNRIGQASGEGTAIIRNNRQFRIQSLTAGKFENEGMFWDVMVADGKKFARQYRGKWKKAQPIQRATLLQRPLLGQAPERFTEWMFAPLVARENFFSELLKEAKSKGLIVRAEKRVNVIDKVPRTNGRLVFERTKKEARAKGDLFMEFISDQRTGLVVGVTCRVAKQETLWRSMWNLEPAQRFKPSDFLIPKEAR